MLSEITPGKESVDELHLLSELNATCKQMQRRVLDLLSTVTTEEVTCRVNCLGRSTKLFQPNFWLSTTTSTVSLKSTSASVQVVLQSLHLPRMSI